MSPDPKNGSYRWFALAILTLVYACHYIDRSVVGIVMEPIKHEFGFSDKQMGLFSGLAYSLPYMVCVVPLGILADRVNRARMLGALLLVWSGATALASASSSFVGLAATRLLVGAAESGASPVALSLIGQYFKKEERSTAIGIFFLASAIGTIVAFGIGGYVVGNWGWRAAFLLAGAPGVLLTPLVLFALRDRRDARTTTSKTSAVSGLRTLLRGPLRQARLIHLAAGGMLATGIIAGVWGWAAPFFVRVHGMDLKHAGLIVAAGAGLAGAMGSLLSGRLSDLINSRWPGRGVLLACGAMVGLAVLGAVFCYSDSRIVSVGAFWAWSLLATMFMAPYYASGIGMVDEAERATLLSILQLLNNLVGYALGPLLVGIVSDHFGSLRPAISLLASLGLWAALHFFWSVRTGERDDRTHTHADRAPV